MLNSREAEEKEFEELFEAAMSQILLYDSGWTNYNRSDPGVTVLENLTAFYAVQRQDARRITDEVREKLCAMAGFERRQGAAATVYLTDIEQAGDKKAHKNQRLLQNQKLYAGDLCFETEKEVETGNGEITGVFREIDGHMQDITENLSYSTPESVYVFGKAPKSGNCLYLSFRTVPEPGSHLRIMVRSKAPFPRNFIPVGTENIFAEIEWSLYTENGYTRLCCVDESGAFLQDGMVELLMPIQPGCADPAISKQGYTVRCELRRASYDMAPRIVSLIGNLFPVRQQDTLAQPFFLTGRDNQTVRSAMLEDAWLSVYGLEEDGFYYEYREEGTHGAERIFRREENGAGETAFWLEGGKPCRQENGREEITAVVVLRSRALMPHYRLGTVYGYVGEELSLEPFSHILQESFLIAACVETQNGERKYRFFRPNETQPGALRYALAEDNAAVCILDAGDFEEAELLLCGCTVSLGEKGNIRPDNEFSRKGQKTAEFYNPAAGRGGRIRETVWDVKKRFMEDIHRTYNLVTAEDYENAVRELPGLAIHKVRAFAVPGKNEIRIAVKPYGEETFPYLPEIYKKTILQEVNRRRMLTSDVRLLVPSYVPIDVHGMIFIKPFYENCEERIERVIRQILDGVSSERPFGAVLSLHEIYRAVEAIDGVEEVYHLSIHPAAGAKAKRVGADIRMLESGLCCPGRIEVEYSRKYTKV